MKIQLTIKPSIGNEVFYIRTTPVPPPACPVCRHAGRIEVVHPETNKRFSAPCYACREDTVRPRYNGERIFYHFWQRFVVTGVEVTVIKQKGRRREIKNSRLWCRAVGAKKRGVWGDPDRDWVLSGDEVYLTQKEAQQKVDALNEHFKLAQADYETRGRDLLKAVIDDNKDVCHPDHCSIPA